MAKVAAEARKLPGVAFATNYMYTCSEPGQEEIKQAIVREKLNRIVVAACSPRMHELTFRRTIEKAGLNRYFLEMANIREHVSWIGLDKELNTNKAFEAVKMAVGQGHEQQAIVLFVVQGEQEGARHRRRRRRNAGGPRLCRRRTRGGPRREESQRGRHDGPSRQDLSYHRLLHPVSWGPRWWMWPSTIRSSSTRIRR